jgi:hypothetical protein
MRRVFWVALGATVGVLVVRRLSRAADSYSPAGLSRSVGNLGEAVREFGQQVREGMSEREAELRTGLGLDGSHDVVDAHTTATAASPDFRLAANPTGRPGRPG